MPIEEIAQVGRTFGAVIKSHEPGELPGPPLIQVTVVQSRLDATGVKTLGADCVSEAELRGQIQRLKDDLDWVERLTVRAIRKVK